MQYPDEPRVHGAKHGAVGHDGVPDLVHVVHQPAQLDGAEVGADREARLVLQARWETERKESGFLVALRCVEFGLIYI